MKIEIINRSEKAIEECDYRGAVEFNIDGKREAGFADGEPEDSNLCRDFSDVYSIPGLMRKAWEAGKAGEQFEVTTSESDDI